MEDKQEAKFRNIVGWVGGGDRGLAVVFDYVEGHPRLDNEMQVGTSKVERIVYDEGYTKVMEIITKNTHYTRIEE